MTLLLGQRNFVPMDDTKPLESWQRAASLTELQAKGRLVVKLGKKQLALFATEQGLFACNNRCPHEGYPLSEGTLDAACRLTCNWHNWKFNLGDGSNATGGDALRVYPVEQRGDEVWVQIIEPPASERQAQALARLQEAMADREFDRMARELARFLAAGGEPARAVTTAIEATHDHLEFGWTHAYAGAPAWLRLHDEVAQDDAERLVALTEALDHMADDTLRQPCYPYPTSLAGWSAKAYLQAVEREDETAAQSLLNGALAAGLRFSHLEETLLQAALAHYADFGHSLIYVVACGQLIERLGQAAAAPLLRALVRQQISASREDLIPEFRSYAEALTSFKAGQGTDVPDLLQADVKRALSAVSQSGAAPERLFHKLLTTNAQRLLCFDTHFDESATRGVTDNATWLDVTHGLTFAAALLQSCRRYPALWPQGLLQMACFAGRNLVFAKAQVAVTDWAVPTWATFYGEQRRALLDHGLERPILAVHRLKTLEAAAFLIAEVPSEAALLAAAVRRYLATPMKGKHTLRTARQSLTFVAREG